MHVASDRITRLLEWCFTHGVRIDPRLEIKEDDDTGISVFSREEYISCPTTLVHIPSSAVLSVKSSSASDHIPPESYGRGAHFALAVAVYIEILHGEDSHWFGYLQTLPQEPVPLALFWGVSDERLDAHADNQSAGGVRFRDSQEAVTWITGTELEKEMRGSAGTSQTLLQDICDYYFVVAKGLLSRLFRHDNRPVSLGGFLHAYSLVSSRAFLVDAYHGLAMVPIADAFNHTEENHVHLESDFDVCTACGAFEECPHDREDEEDLVPRRTSANTFGKTMAKSISATGVPESVYEMVSNAPILPRSEVFNTYGENLTNAQLLVRYGFSLDSNENDCITWDWADLWAFAATALDEEPRDTSGSSGRRPRSVDDVMQLYTQAINLWPSENSGWAETGIVYNSETATASTTVNKMDSNSGIPERYAGWAPHGVVLCLNGDGRISHHLWLYCALLGHQHVIDATNGGVEEVVGLLREVAGLLMRYEKEALLEDYSDDDNGNNGAEQRHREGSADWNGPRQPFCSPRTPIVEVAANTIRTIMCLCRSRSSRIGKGDLNALDIGELLDRAPHMTRTRMAMVEVLSEKSLLESVESVWSNIEKRLSLE